MTFKRSKHLSSLLGCGAALLIATGCVSIPQQVKIQVDETRDAVAELHQNHAQTARALQRLLAEREQNLMLYRNSIREALRLQLRAQADSVRANILADYEREVVHVLGPGFQDMEQNIILAKFKPSQAAARKALIRAKTTKDGSPFDPDIQKTINALAFEIIDLQDEREAASARAVVAIYNRLDAHRSEFRAIIDTSINKELNAFLAQSTADLDAAIKVLPDDFQQFDAKFAELDKAYADVDHSLDKVSTYIDAESTTGRFVGSAVKGVSKGLFDQLTASKGAGLADVARLFGAKGQDFADKLKTVETDMHKQAVSDITKITNGVPASEPSAPVQSASAAPQESQ